jgi:ATP-binding cassette subfamily B protein
LSSTNRRPALDPLAELAWFERFATLAAGHTAALISHRLGPTKLADRVLVLEEGRLVEQGPPQQFLADGGLFARMFASPLRGQF